MDASDTHRVFSERELADAGRLTVDLIAESLERGQVADAKSLLQRFEEELMTMFFSYTGWDASILDCCEELGGQAFRDDVLKVVNNYDIAPERQVETAGVAQRWQAEIVTISGLIDEGASVAAAERAGVLRLEALSLHDGLMSRVAALLSQVYESHGEDTLNTVLQRVMNPGAMDPDGRIPFREKVENIMCFTRSHLLPFTVTEDAEKVTFMPNPCPSGARLIQAGHYESPRSGAIVRGAGPLTYGREDFPVYCCHEPAMELSSILSTGIPLFLVDPPDDVGISPCKVHVYKDPAQIPEHYYQRLGLSKPEDLIARSR
jgi:hypothetical protein